MHEHYQHRRTPAFVRACKGVDWPRIHLNELAYRVITSGNEGAGIDPSRAPGTFTL